MGAKGAQIPLERCAGRLAEAQSELGFESNSGFDARVLGRINNRAGLSKGHLGLVLAPLGASTLASDLDGANDLSDLSVLLGVTLRDLELALDDLVLRDEAKERLSGLEGTLEGLSEHRGRDKLSEGRTGITRSVGVDNESL